MVLHHSSWLVLLSLIVAAQGSYVSLLLADEVDYAAGLRRRLLLAAAAVTLAVSIWSMHFVGMLAAHFSVAVDFLVLPTLISFLICVLMVGAGVLIVHTAYPRPLRIAGGAVAMGAGVATMHYVGMAALDFPGHLHHAPAYVAAAVLVAIATSAVALWQMERPVVRAPRAASAVILGLAISGMHYTAMAGMTVLPSQGSAIAPLSAEPSLSHSIMAMVVAVVAFVISGAFLLSLAPDRDDAGETTKAHPPTSIAGNPGAAPLRRPEREDVAADGAPLDAAGIPARRYAAEIEVEKDGLPRSLPVAGIVSVRANAHYTYVSNGSQEFFCRQTIGEIEAMLDPTRFMRVHRSHIVSIEHIESVRRAGDAGVAEIDAAVQHSIPVARGRLSLLRRRVAVPPV